MPVIVFVWFSFVQCMRAESVFLTAAIGAGCDDCKGGVSPRVQLRTPPKQAPMEETELETMGIFTGVARWGERRRKELPEYLGQSRFS